MVDRKFVNHFTLARSHESDEKHGVEYVEAFHGVGPQQADPVEKYVRHVAVPVKQAFTARPAAPPGRQVPVSKATGDRTASPSDAGIRIDTVTIAPAPQAPVVMPARFGNLFHFSGLFRLYGPRGGSR